MYISKFCSPACVRGAYSLARYRPSTSYSLYGTSTMRRDVQAERMERPEGLCKIDELLMAVVELLLQCFQMLS